MWRLTVGHKARPTANWPTTCRRPGLTSPWAASLRAEGEPARCPTGADPRGGARLTKI